MNLFLGQFGVTSHDRVIDRLDHIIRASAISEEHYKVWRALVKACDGAVIASNYCPTCDGERYVTAPCCDGSACGCYGRGVSVDCPACDGRGWVW